MYYLVSLVFFAIFRFICTWLMRFMTPRKLLTLLSFAAMVCTLTTIFIRGYIGVYALICIPGCIPGCMSLMFPTMFGLAVKGLGDDAKIAGSRLIMGILGGAVLTAIQGQVSDVNR